MYKSNFIDQKDGNNKTIPKHNNNWNTYYNLNQNFKYFVLPKYNMGHILKFRGCL